MVRIPKLRFPEFKGEWEWKRLGEITKINQGLQIPISQRFLEPSSDRKFYITNEFIKNRSKGYYIENPPQSVCCDENDILMTRTGNTGQVVSGVVGAFHNNFFKVKYCHNEICKDFLFEFLRSYKTQVEILKLAGTSTIPDLNHKDFYRIGISIPLLSEQQKIASFLLKIDERLDLLRKKYTTLQRYKKGVMQQIFSQQIRFKQDDGSDFPEWKIVKLRDVLKERKERNLNNTYYEVFSVAKKQGVINQIEHLGRSYASSNISNYKVLRPSDIVYTKSPTSHFPYGIIKQNQTQRIGVVSVLYAVFIPENKHLGYLLHSYFLSCINTYNYLNSLVQKGAKNTININNTDFLNGADFALPESVVEQQKIAIFLSNLDQQLEVLNQQIKENERYKKGLLQEMFV